MDQNISEKLQRAGLAFGLPGSLVSFEEITAGNINRTYRVDFAAAGDQDAAAAGPAAVKSYIVQQINSYAFKNADGLMSNIGKVTEFLREKRPDRTNMHFYRTGCEGREKAYYEDEGGIWRVCDFIPGVSFDRCDDLEIVRGAGEAFGEFQLLLSDFPAEELYYTIPDFHNTPKRYEALLKTVREDPCGRAAQCEEELRRLLSVKKEACLLTELYERGDLPLRVTHNDTKINNVLFDEKTKRPLCVIDLDTVMPGLAGSDFGDAVRSAANTLAEDAQQPEKASLDLEIFRAFAEGFLGKTAKTLTPRETQTLAASCFCITCELAVRLLEDYIAGDRYFKIKPGRSNLLRARCQIALAEDMKLKAGEMQKIIDELAGRQ